MSEVEVSHHPHGPDEPAETQVFWRFGSPTVMENTVKAAFGFPPLAAVVYSMINKRDDGTTCKVVVPADYVFAPNGPPSVVATWQPVACAAPGGSTPFSADSGANGGRAKRPAAPRVSAKPRDNNWFKKLVKASWEVGCKRAPPPEGGLFSCLPDTTTNACGAFALFIGEASGAPLPWEDQEIPALVKAAKAVVDADVRSVANGEYGDSQADVIQKEADTEAELIAVTKSIRKSIGHASRAGGTAIGRSVRRCRKLEESGACVRAAVCFAVRRGGLTSSACAVALADADEPPAEGAAAADGAAAMAPRKKRAAVKQSGAGAGGGTSGVVPPSPLGGSKEEREAAAKAAAKAVKENAAAKQEAEEDAARAAGEAATPSFLLSGSAPRRWPGLQRPRRSC